jgi:hypothetical protein
VRTQQPGKDIQVLVPGRGEDRPEGAQWPPLVAQGRECAGPRRQALRFHHRRAADHRRLREASIDTANRAMPTPWTYSSIASPRASRRTPTPSCCSIKPDSTAGRRSRCVGGTIHSIKSVRIPHQGNRLKKSCSDEACEEVIVPSGDFAFEAQRLFSRRGVCQSSGRPGRQALPQPTRIEPLISGRTSAKASRLAD